MATIYEIEDKYKFIQRLIEEGAPEEAFIEALKAIDGELSEKLENYAAVIKNIESDINGLKAEEARLNERRKSMENNIKRMKESMQEAMVTANIKSIKGEKFNFNVQKNPPSLTVLDENLIPRMYFDEAKPVLNKKLVIKALKDGFEIKGAEVNNGESIRIR